MKLAKDHVDVALFTNRAPEVMRFWQEEVGLPFEETLGTGSGQRQHRHGMNGSVLKINEARAPLERAAPSGYRSLIVARAELAAPKRLVDPDGNVVTIVPPGTEGVEGVAVHLAVRDEAAFHDFYGRVLELERVGERTHRCGDSLLVFHQTEDALGAATIAGPGYRYLTIQIWDVEAEHAGLLARGAEEGRPPVTAGAIARFSFVRDPDGNWIEISQRASLTGPLPAQAPARA